MAENKKVFIFGVFDGLHEGHRFFINEALKLSGDLTISVAQDNYVEKYKGKIPKNSLSARIAKIKEVYPRANIISGDVKINTWTGINKSKPDIIFLGYDQNNLKKALENLKWKDKKPQFIVAKPFKEDIFHSSKL